MATWSLHIKSRGRCAPARPSHASPPAHVVVVRVQDFEYKLSQTHTLDATYEQALYAGIRDHQSICAQLAAFEAANGLQGRNWIPRSIFTYLGAFERNHPRFGWLCAPYHGPPPVQASGSSRASTRRPALPTLSRVLCTSTTCSVAMPFSSPGRTSPSSSFTAASAFASCLCGMHKRLLDSKPTRR